MNPAAADSYEINFTIPRGDTGPTGPTNTTAIGFLYDPSRDANSDFQSNIPYQFDSLSGRLGLNVTYNFDSSEITYLVDGCYKFDFGTVIQIPNASIDNAYIVRVYISVNNGASASESVSLTINDDSLYYFYTSPFINLNAGDVVSLVAVSNKAGNFKYSSPHIYGHRVSDKIGIP